MRLNLKEFRTKKYKCYFCGRKDMIPNEDKGYIKGWKCQICGHVNNPSKNQVKQKETK